MRLEADTTRNERRQPIARRSGESDFSRAAAVQLRCIETDHPHPFAAAAQGVAIHDVALLLGMCRIGGECEDYGDGRCGESYHAADIGRQPQGISLNAGSFRRRLKHVRACINLRATSGTECHREGEPTMSRDLRREPRFGPTEPETAPTVPAAHVAAGRLAAVSFVDGAEKRPGIRWGRRAIDAAIILALLIGVPMAIEEARGPCVALELRALRITTDRSRPDARTNTLGRAMADALFRDMATGQLAASLMRDSVPFLPSALSCGGRYWIGLAAPGTLDFMRGSARRPL